MMINNSEPNILCARDIGKEGMLRITGRQATTPFSKPPPSLFYAAGFAFSLATVVTEVPYDIQLKNLFFGEEISMVVHHHAHIVCTSQY